MSTTVHGIHHVTVIAGDAQENLDFYTRIMGMRLVKKSVNQDAPDTYHLFYADGDGTPGTDLTFFPWPKMPPVRLGIGLTVAVPFAIPEGSLQYWQERFDKFDVKHGQIEIRFGERTLPFWDPHGLELALVEIGEERAFTAWDKGPVPAAHQLRGMHAVRLWERELTATEKLLTEVMGFKSVAVEADWHRYEVDGGGSGKIIELKILPDHVRGAWGTGGVHHVAWRVHDDAEEMAVRQQVIALGLHPTAQIDRFWFRSVYFKEPGGVLFELATDGPGFARDEDKRRLGEQLILPPWLESQRAAIEAALPDLVVR